MRRLAVGMAILGLAAVALSWAVADDKEIAKEITERLKREQDSGNLDGFDINLKVAEGNVLLKGHVSNPKQQELALDIARRAKGVKRVVNDLAVQGEDSAPTAVANESSADAPDDPKIAASLAQALRKLKDGGGLKGFRINFDVTDGIVVMKGTVSSDEQHKLALQTARSTLGVKDVTDELSVRTAPAQTAAAGTPAISDSQIAKQIAAALKARQDSGGLKGFCIDLSVDDGVAVLTGNVSDPAQCNLVAEIAKATDGVREVVNHMVVAQKQPLPQPVDEPTPAVAMAASAAEEGAIKDVDIARQIADELRKQKSLGNLQRFNIDLSVENGVVVYEGRVASAEQIALAMDIARNAGGVRDIVNHLDIVRPLTNIDAAFGANAQEARLSDRAENRLVSADVDLQSQSEAETAEYTPTPAGQPVIEVANAIYQPGEQTSVTPEQVAQDQRIGEILMQKLQQAKQKGGLRGFGIGVHVNGGTVRLGGRVSSPEQQELALDVARRIPGVRLVVNELKVVETPIFEASSPRREAIARELGQRLQAEDARGNLDGCDFNVKVSGGDVWLSGKVASSDQEKLAVETAEKTPGVERVMSALTVAGSQASLASVEVPTNASIDAGPAAAASTSLRPTIGHPARITISPAGSPARSASVGALPQVAPVIAQLNYPAPQARMVNLSAANQTPRPLGLAQMAAYAPAAALAAPLVAIGQAAGGMPSHLPGPGHAVVPARYDHPNLPGYAWPSYSAHPNYAGVTYPKQYSPTAWPYIGPFYPYPQVPLGWRRVSLKWDDGWWQLNFKSK
ncbi:MAG: BON domain-containing protein [Planctomycetes bacterium]|nr:BON domain-containing protein [Planctomycetota bacterium]MBL7041878.1 BON domain-containing protein [Pirellulaceae bacterium]